MLQKPINGLIIDFGNIIERKVIQMVFKNYYKGYKKKCVKITIKNTYKFVPNTYKNFRNFYYIVGTNMKQKTFKKRLICYISIEYVKILVTCT